MLLIDMDDILNFITLAVNFDIILNSETLELEDKKEICTQKLIPFIDEDISASEDLEKYIIDRYKEFVPNLFFSKDAIESITSFFDQGEYSVLYRGSIGKEKYAETGGSVCEEVHDKLIEQGIYAKNEYNVSFYFNPLVAEKILRNYAEIYTSSSEMANLACSINSVDRVFFQVNSVNCDVVSPPNLSDKIILVDNIYHLCQIRQILSK